MSENYNTPIDPYWAVIVPQLNYIRDRGLRYFQKSDLDDAVQFVSLYLYHKLKAKPFYNTQIIRGYIKNGLRQYWQTMNRYQQKHIDILDVYGDAYHPEIIVESLDVPEETNQDLYDYLKVCPKQGVIILKDGETDGIVYPNAKQAAEANDIDYGYAYRLLRGERRHHKEGIQAKYVVNDNVFNKIQQLKKNGQRLTNSNSRVSD